MRTPASPAEQPAAGAEQSGHDAATLFVAAAFGLYVALGLIGAGGRLLAIAFPLGFFGLALLAYARDPATYLGVVVWSWLVTPFVRRVFDMHYGFHPTSTILLAPLLASILSIFTVLRRARMLRSTAYAPFLVATAALTYAFLIGVIRQSAAAATYDLLTWIAPIAFGLHLALEWRRFPRFRTTISSCALWGVLLTALYGIYQFVSPPLWDRAWVVSAEMASVGNPTPFVIRVFSTLNAPGPYSVFLIFGLLIGLASPQRWRAIVLALGLVVFILCKTRSAWGAFVLGALVMQLRQPLRSLPRQWVALVAVFLLAAPIITTPRVMSVLTHRAASLRDVRNDNSFQTRVNFTRYALASMSSNPAGSGLGALGGAGKLLTGSNGGFALDSGPLEIYSVMGWLGGTLFMLSLLAILLPIVRSRRVRFEPITSAAVSVVVAVMFTSIFGNIFNSVSGFFFWCAVGLATSGRSYAQAVDMMQRFGNRPDILAQLTLRRPAA